MKTSTIRIDWTDEQSISAAERQKERLENEGYRLTTQAGGMFQSTLTYTRHD